MIEPVVIALTAGFVLGLSSTLHCACMCGGIASGYAFLAGPNEEPAQRLRTLLMLQVGRISVYAIVGAISAGAAAQLLDPFASELNFRILQWLGAAVLMWVGLSMAGVLPRFAFAGEGILTLAPAPLRWLNSIRGHPVMFPIAMGVSWGFTPCPMVLAALFSATLTGSLVTGGAWMIGFGAGTVPAVLCAAFGITALARFGQSAYLHMLAGLAIAALGLTSVLLDWPVVGLLCTPR